MRINKKTIKDDSYSLLKINNQEFDMFKTIIKLKYLGVPLGSNRIWKVLFVQGKIANMMEFFDKTVQSDLDPNLIIHSVNTFLTP
jgi:hypothetical protein